MRIALCYEQALVGQAVTSLLSHEGNFDVVGTEKKPRACVAIAKEQRAQVIIVDDMGLEKNDLEFLMGARAFGDFGVALITDRPPAEYDEFPLDRIYTRSEGGNGLIKAIREMGNSFPMPQTGRSRESHHTPQNDLGLSRRELEVALLVAKGYSNRKISEVVGLKEQSIKNLVSVIMRKLKCENRVQVALRLSQLKLD